MRMCVLYFWLLRTWRSFFLPPVCGWLAKLQNLRMLKACRLMLEPALCAVNYERFSVVQPAGDGGFFRGMI
ncbi:hypothetical protein DQD42_24615 [Salmonella enterica subsp. enterica serovar Senftenberg]|nr:hypothetical protein [Salmonella enterica subsp. enterica serovar Senftenberg]